MSCFCGKKRSKPKPVPTTNPVYEIKKSLGEIGLEGGIRFNKNEGKSIHNKLECDLGLRDLKIVEVATDVIDDDTGTTHDLWLRKRPFKEGQRWGFYEDWYEKVVLPRNFKGDEVIGFYIDQKKDIHFKVLGTDRGEGE